MKNYSIALVAVLALAACHKKKASAPCPTKYRELAADLQKADATCSCVTGNSGTVWGVGIYTTDSSICSAAVHAGVLDAKAAGDVTVRKAAGCPNYSGGAANGVTTQEWGAFDASFYFPSKGDGKCPPAKAPEAAAAVAVPAAPAGSAAAPAAGDACPDTFDAVPAGTDSLDCKCAAVPANGSVWGVGIYTSDSSICRAAAHAGAIQAAGGPVKVKRAAGCKKYNGSTANGIDTQSWGEHGGSFYFDGKGDGKCS